MKPAARKAVEKIEQADRPLTESEAFGHIRYSKNRVYAAAEAIASGRVRKDRSHYRNGSGAPRYAVNQ